MLRVNARARELADRDEAAGGDLSGRMTLGVYYFEEDEKTKT